MNKLGNNIDIIKGKSVIISDKDAEKISKELTGSETVYSATKEWIKDTSNKLGCILLRDKDKNIPIAYITIYIYDVLYKGYNIYERIRLWVDKKYQGKGLGIFLIQELTNEYTNKPFISCTMNSKVGHINTFYLGYKEILKNDIPFDLWEILEIPGKLDKEKYRFYINDILENIIKNE